ncbi:lysophospholipid acyltransferase family protein [Bradymonas sediminis]|uniref:Glycerol acyltransferase n=1 Tax=Bradymonas sediminis TaxID=1548548 RepID=A0A2Z4FIZ1_9DELT|nr:lysophospholipid acyltransferase family protein [Bradymonas sediminis]AWV88893.1 glycerol acyltransferase [Bradymonas sediminis]TDP71898.1 1-acyl-sn-glycerol-3-phosphate acyltransferase [Bradymonas sediminis]
MLKFFAKIYLKLVGWSVDSELPEGVDKFVIIAAPHTSNWDFPITLAVAAMIDMKFFFVGKHTMFRPPVGGLFKKLGGIPVDRSKSRNFVDQIADAFAQADRMALGIAPEGTRSKRKYWKSGFYYIARAADVPIVLGYLDYKTRRGGLGPIIDSSQPVEVVMEQVREFYAGKEGRNHDQYTPPRLRVEDEAAEDAAEAPKAAAAKAEQSIEETA